MKKQSKYHIYSKYYNKLHITDEKLREIEIAIGLHSNIPKCCVMSYVDTTFEDKQNRM